MKTTITIKSEQLNKEDLRSLLQAIRLCERATFTNKEIYLKVEVPELTSDEANEILMSIKPPYKWGPKTFRFTYNNDEKT